jgi:hypothetical protein
VEILLTEVATGKKLDRHISSRGKTLFTNCLIGAGVHFSTTLATRLGRAAVNIYFLDE